MITADDEKLWSYDLARERSYWTIRDLNAKPLREWVNNSSTGVEQWTWSRDWIWRGEALLAAQSPSRGVMHVDVDPLGTPRLFTDAVGYAVANQKFFPFGEETGSFTEEKLRFTAHERASAYELYSIPPPLDYMHARWYSPEIARFLSPDPIGGDPSMPGSFNRYGYVVNDPMNRIDPDGLFFRELWKAIKNRLSPARGEDDSSDCDGCVTFYDTYDVTAPDPARQRAREAYMRSAYGPSRAPEGFTLGLGLGLSLVTPTGGGEVSLAWLHSLAIGPEHNALAASGGFGLGVNVSADAYIAILRGPAWMAEGSTDNVNVGFSFASMTFMFADYGFAGMTLGAGPGVTPIALSGTASGTRVMTLGDMQRRFGWGW